MNTLDSSRNFRILSQKNADLILIRILQIKKELTFLIDGILLLSFKGAAQRSCLVLCIVQTLLSWGRKIIQHNAVGLNLIRGLLGFVPLEVCYIL